MYSPRKPTEPLNGETTPTLTSPVNPVGAGVDVAAVAGVDVAAGDGACPHATITSEAAKRLRAPVVEMDRHLVVELPVIPAPFQPCLRARGSS